MPTRVCSHTLLTGYLRPCELYTKPELTNQSAVEMYGPVHTGREALRNTRMLWNTSGQWECSHSLQATSQGLHANLRVLARRV